MSDLIFNAVELHKLLLLRLNIQSTTAVVSCVIKEFNRTIDWVKVRDTQHLAGFLTGGDCAGIYYREQNNDLYRIKKHSSGEIEYHVAAVSPLGWSIYSGWFGRICKNVQKIYKIQLSESDKDYIFARLIPFINRIKHYTKNCLA